MPQRRIDGFEIFVYTRNELGHRPHVHVFGNSRDCAIYLDPVSVRDSRMKASELRRAVRAVKAHREELLAYWSSFHG